ncbi:MAG: uracil-DNA glycosylase [Chloroflexi bacterium]|nr:uracil-DNA glycosylase [Chloroflexota bacterium]
MAERADELATLEQEVSACPLCDLSRTRKRAVPGEGPVDAEVMFIGEGPGFNEDQQGRPFVGPAGRLLNELLASIGLARDQVYITNVVKCRPPNNRDPMPQEIAACAPYLERQLALIKPKVVVTLGRYSMAKFFPGASITKIHGQPKRIGATFYFPMFHPAAALRQESYMAAVKADMLKIPALIEEARKVTVTDDPAPAEGQEDAPVQLGLFDV